jgi:hypothetical protein
MRGLPNTRKEDSFRELAQDWTWYPDEWLAFIFFSVPAGKHCLGVLDGGKPEVAWQQDDCGPSSGQLVHGPLSPSTMVAKVGSRASRRREALLKVKNPVGTLTSRSVDVWKPSAKLQDLTVKIEACKGMIVKMAAIGTPDEDMLQYRQRLIVLYAEVLALNEPSGQSSSSF